MALVVKSVSGALEAFATRMGLDGGVDSKSRMIPRMSHTVDPSSSRERHRYSSSSGDETET